ncbi:hypothetical protein [Candidatus Magnetomonas plexicatena]|uniref:hypothetical protein n=1 Tax=Candidatus Magnetomonas plexicatena TaxID=2552947 RepID=UPI001103C20E|nr:hypothetical protein E2O03_010040 [Nitrospirales bacterium LBB_01]
MAKNIEFIPLARESFLAIKSNTLIITPTIIFSLILSMFTYKYLGPGLTKLSSLSTQSLSPKDLALFKELIGKLAIANIINFYMQMFVHAITLAMARELIVNGTLSYRTALAEVFKKFSSLLFSVTLFGILLVIGVMLLIVPAILVNFFFMFTYVAIIKDNKHSFTAIRESIKLVRHNLNAAFSIYVTLFTTAITVSIMNMLTTSVMESISETNALRNAANSILNGILSGIAHDKYDKILNIINNTPAYLAIAVTTILTGVVMAFIALMILKTYDVLKEPDSAGAVVIEA